MEDTVAWDSVTLLLCERFLYLKIVFKKDYRTDFHLKVSPIVVKLDFNLDVLVF